MAQEKLRAYSVRDGVTGYDDEDTLRTAIPKLNRMLTELYAGVGGGAVTSVNDEVGDVVLDADDVGAAGTSNNAFTGDQQIDGASPRFLFNETDQALDEKLWDIIVEGKVLKFRTRTDADGAGQTIFSVTRGEGTALTLFNFGTSLSGFNFANGGLNAESVSMFGTAPAFYCNETDGDANEKNTYLALIDGGVIRGQFLNDAFNATREFYSVSRNGVAVESMTWGNATDNPSFTFLGTGIPGHGGSQLLRTTASLTDGASVGAGTLANAPSAGNPTKWVSINDNGTTRWIPTWT